MFFFLCTRKPGHLLLGFATSGSVCAILGIPRKNFNIKDQRKEPTILEPGESIGKQFLVNSSGHLCKPC